MARQVGELVGGEGGDTVSRPRKYAEAAEAKRQVLDLPDDDDDQFDWQDVEDDDEPDADSR